MNILEIKYPYYQTELKELYSILKFKDYKLELKGSSKYINLKYPSDYDLYSKINKKDITDFLDFLNNLIHKIKTNIYMYFIELKVEYPTKKLKFFKDDYIKIPNKQNINIIKLDIIIFSNNRFKEVSIIYDFGEKQTVEEIIKNISEDIRQLEKEKKYFKIFKRLFSLANIKEDFHSLGILLDILNSELGEINLKVNNIETIRLLQKNYKDFLTNERIKLNMYFLGTNNLDETYTNLNNELIEKSKLLLKQIGFLQ